MAIMTSMPLRSGSLRSMSITSGLCFAKEPEGLSAGGRLRHKLHVRLVIDDHGNAPALQRMVVNAEHPDV